MDLTTVQRLVARLESDDAFDRRDAIELLAILTQERLDFRWSADDDERVVAVRRWRRWVAREEKRRGRVALSAQVQILPEGVVDKQALAKLLSKLPVAQKKALMAQVIAKVAAEHAEKLKARACQECEKNAASARLTRRNDDGTYTLHLLCEACVHKDGG